MSKLSFPKIMTGCFHFMPHTLVKKKKNTFTKESTTPQKPHREALNEQMIMRRNERKDHVLDGYFSLALSLSLSLISMSLWLQKVL